MDRQTQMNGNSDAPETTRRRVFENAGDLWHHILLLSELQIRLFWVEAEDGIRQARPGLFLMVMGLLLGLASIPVVLAALALTVIERADVTPAVAFGIVALIAMAIAVGLTAGGWRALKSRSLGVPRSRNEWGLNWRWLKESLRPKPRR